MCKKRDKCSKCSKCQDDIDNNGDRQRRSRNIYAWGFDGSGQYGNGTNTNSFVPVIINSSGILSSKIIISIAAGQDHTLFLTNNGQVFAAGTNFSGQLGVGNNTDSNILVGPVQGLLTNRPIYQISAGSGYSVVIDAAGNVFTWGAGSAGQLGNGANSNSNVPVPVDTSGVMSGKRIVQIAIGTAHVLALDSEGDVFAWGDNGSGELGDGTNTSSNVPVQVLTGQKFVAVSAGSFTSYGLTTTGQVYSWGDNGVGQLGDGTNTSSNVPIPVFTGGVLSGKTIVKISAGSDAAYAIDTNGDLYSWGGNTFGQLGIGSLGGSSNVPVVVINISNVKNVQGGRQYALAQTIDNKIYSWGLGNEGQLGLGNSILFIESPTLVDLTTTTKIFTGSVSRTSFAF